MQIFLPPFTFHTIKRSKDLKPTYSSHSTPKKSPTVLQKRQPSYQIALDLQEFSKYGKSDNYFKNSPSPIVHSLQTSPTNEGKSRKINLINRTQTPHYKYKNKALTKSLQPTLTIKKQFKRKVDSPSSTPPKTQKEQNQFMICSFLTTRKLQQIQLSRPHTQKITRSINNIHYAKKNPSFFHQALDQTVYRPWSPQKIGDSLFPQDAL